MRWREGVSDNGKADDIILEVQRLWPPFFGGRRVCVEVCVNVYCRQWQNYTLDSTTFFGSLPYPKPGAVI